MIIPFIAPYILLFAVTAVLVGIAGSPRNRSKLVRGMTATAAIVLVSVFAGIRDYSVGGPDVMIYGNKIFRAMALTPDLGGITQYASDRNADGEVGYYFLNWVVSRFTEDPHVFYTILAALCSTAILTAIMLVREWGSPVVMWLTYMLTAYVEGFNLLRQSPALALAVLGVALVLRNRYRLGFVVGACGLLFHNSAIVYFVMWGVAYYLKTRHENLRRAIWTVLIVSVLSLAAISPALQFLGSSLGDSKYQEYLGAGAKGGRAFGIDALYRAVPIIIGVWALVATRVPSAARPSPYTRSRNLSGRARTKQLSQIAPRTEADQTARRVVIIILVLLALELILLPVREISYPFYRLLAYFGYLRILGYGMIAYLFRQQRLIAEVLAVAFAVAYFALIIIGRNEAFYGSAILESWIRAN